MWLLVTMPIIHKCSSGGVFFFITPLPLAKKLKWEYTGVISFVCPSAIECFPNCNWKRLLTNGYDTSHMWCSWPKENFFFTCQRSRYLDFALKHFTSRFGYNGILLQRNGTSKTPNIFSRSKAKVIKVCLWKIGFWTIILIYTDDAVA